MPNLTVGAAAAEKISEDAKQSFGFRVPQAVFKDGETQFVHFITPHDALIALTVHQFIPTKPKPDEFKGNKWPETMWGGCQNDRTFRIRDEEGNLTDAFEEGYGSCYIDTAYAGRIEGKYKKDMGKPSNQVFGLAVERKPVTDGSGAIVAFTDETIEFTAKDGTKYTLPKLILVNQKWSNFWHPVAATAYLEPKTILDKDFMVLRRDKEYTITPVAQTPDLQPGTPGWEKYMKAMEVTGFDLGAYLLDHATPDHYARFFIPGVTPSGGYGRGSSGEDGEEESTQAAEQPAASPSGPQVDQEALRAFQSQLASRGKPAAEAAAS